MMQKIGSSKSVWIQYINIFPEQHSKKNTFVEKKWIEASGADCIPVVVLKNCEPELS